MFEPPNAMALDAQTLSALADASNGDPFAVLGPWPGPRGRVIRAYLHGAKSVAVTLPDGKLVARLEERLLPGLFLGIAGGEGAYRLRIAWPDRIEEITDPYAFGLLLDDSELESLAAGTHWRADLCLGAHCLKINGVAGTRFAVWAPNARQVSVIGDFNGWDARRHPMRLRHAAGVWELFLPDVGAGARYKFSLLTQRGDRLEKADPYARAAELPPATASIVAAPLDIEWSDGDWLAARAERQAPDAAMSIYEVHLGSWVRPAGREADWDSAIATLVPYVTGLGFTHIELMPIAEHPFGGSWGYQPLSQFAASARYGSPEGFARFVDACHAAGIGVILDWVPAHFPDDAHGLVCFDGTELYEHADPRMGRHPDWNTLLFNHGRNEVRNFLVSSALRWIEDFHVDGLRVDAVASMLYLDYSRGEGQWRPNVFGGRENLETIAFLRDLNALVRARCPGVLTIAEESTAWPGVTRAASEGGLGFSAKWNMGWMNDTLRYMEREPVHRRWHHGEITFGMMYAYSERFILPLSHDEVVHEKRSLLGKMPGSDDEKRANLRVYLALMWMHPGKKLLFMGGEFGQWREWNHDGELDWDLLENPGHAGISALVRDLNRIYRGEKALAATDGDPSGFRWSIVDDAERGVFAWLRCARGAKTLAAAFNMTPVLRENYRIGVPASGLWREMLNSDAAIYGGSNAGNLGGVQADEIACGEFPCSIQIALPGLSAIVLRHESD